MPAPDATHDPARRSHVEDANLPDCDFPIQNLPYGAFSLDGGAVRIGVAIGSRILDLTLLEAEGLLRPGDSDGAVKVFQGGVLNPFMALEQSRWTDTRRRIADFLDAGADLPSAVRALIDRALVPRAAARMHLPFYARGFTDFYASREHATNVGTMFRGADNALMPNWLHIPVGYNARASTVVVSGTDIRRPLGQLRGPEDAAPRLAPSRKLDFELELGAVVGGANPMGQPVTVAAAYDMIFGYVLLNDWSARDIQVWEYQPLGPFQAKVFGTSVSPWVVTRDALEPFRVATPPRETPLLPYLSETAPGNFDIHLEVALSPRDGGETVISRTNSRFMYYSAAQQLAHHSLCGCAMETGDLLGSGTVSGPTRDSCGSLLELTWNGRDPIEVDGGARTFLEDGDTVALRGFCADGYRVGFGVCAGTILPAPSAAEFGGEE